MARITPYEKLGIKSKLLKFDQKRYEKLISMGGEIKFKRVEIDGTGGEKFYADEIHRIYEDSLMGIGGYTLKNYFSYYKFPIKAVFHRPENESFVCIAVPYYLKKWDGVEVLKGYRNFRIEKSMIKYDAFYEEDVVLREKGVVIVRIPNVFVLSIWASGYVVGKITPLQLRRNIVKHEEVMKYKGKKGWIVSAIAKLKIEARLAKRSGDKEKFDEITERLRREYGVIREHTLLKS